MSEEYSVGYSEGYQAGWNAAMDTTPPAQPAPVQDVVPEGVIAAIRHEGLTLVKDLQGYRLIRLGKVEAQTTTPHAAQTVTCNGMPAYEGSLSAAQSAPAQEPVFKPCSCRWKGEEQVQQCTLHAAHIEAIHEWAERAKTAEAKLKEKHQ